MPCQPVLCVFSATCLLVEVATATCPWQAASLALIHRSLPGFESADSVDERPGTYCVTVTALGRSASKFENLVVRVRSDSRHLEPVQLSCRMSCSVGVAAKWNLGASPCSSRL